jgi:hypothetical protein
MPTLKEDKQRAEHYLAKSPFNIPALGEVDKHGFSLRAIFAMNLVGAAANRHGMTNRRSNAVTKHLLKVMKEKTT